MPSRLSTRAGGHGEPALDNNNNMVANSAAADSAEDLRRVIEEREGHGHLENVRSCCDGESSYVINLS